jgi:Flp pilus assembly protein TadD
VLDSSEKPGEARAYYLRAREVDPNNHEIENNLGVSFLLSGEHAEAAEHLRRATQLDPNDRATHNNLGLTLGHLRRDEEALAEFRLGGTESVAQNNLGYLCYMRGDHEQAIRHYELALAANPEDAKTIIRNLWQARRELEAKAQPGFSAKSE